MKRLSASRGGLARRFLRDTRGGAAAELVLWLTIMLVPVMSVIDIGFYVFQRMQVELAGQAAIQAIRKDCWDSAVPYTRNCSSISSAATTGAQSTLLGSDVTVSSGYPLEGYYCVDASNVLTLVGSTGGVGTGPTKPSTFDCSSVIGSSTASPGTYARVNVQKTYTPVFSGVSVASLLTTPITSSAWLRVE